MRKCKANSIDLSVVILECKTNIREDSISIRVPNAMLIQFRCFQNSQMSRFSKFLCASSNHCLESLNNLWNFELPESEAWFHVRTTYKWITKKSIGCWSTIRYSEVFSFRFAHLVQTLQVGRDLWESRYIMLLVQKRLSSRHCRCRTKSASYGTVLIDGITGIWCVRGLSGTGASEPADEANAHQLQASSVAYHEKLFLDKSKSGRQRPQATRAENRPIEKGAAGKISNLTYN